MAASYKPKDKVIFIPSPVSGEVVSLCISDTKLKYLIEYTDIDGDTHQRYFDEEQIKSAAD